MPVSVDELQIELSAKATSANDAIDKLVGKLDKLSTSLGKLNGSGINGLANGIDKLGRSMQTINSINSKSFTRLAENIQKLGNINVYNLNSSASSLSNITRAFNQLGGVSQSAQQVGQLANSISKLGNKTVVSATQSIPQLANSLTYLMQVLSKAPVVSKNVIGLVNSLANLTSQGSKVGSSSNSIVRSLNNIGNASEKTSKKVFSLASAFGSLYANFFWVIRGIKGVWASIGQTSDYIESFNYYTVAFDKIASEWDEKYESYGKENAKKYTNAFITEMNDSLSELSGLKVDLSEDFESGILTETGLKNLGLNIQEVTQYASQLASVTNSVGQTGEVSLMTAEAFTKLAGDMSSLFNVDYSTVAKNLQSGLIGQSRALYKYGIDITNATLQTYAYELGIEKAVSEMTQMEKMQLRMIAILDQSKVSWGDLADTINTPANMIRQLSNNFKEASMVLGQLFMPLLTKLLPFINGVVLALKNLFVTIAGFLGINISLDSIGSGVGDITEDIYDMDSSLGQAANTAKKLKHQLQGFDKLNVLTTPTETMGAGSGALGGGSSIDLSEEIKNATEEYQKAWDEAYKNMENKAAAFAKNVEKALQPIKDFFYHLSIGDFFSAGKDVSNLVVSIFDFMTRAIESVDWNAVGENIGDFIKGIDFKEILFSVSDLIGEGIQASIDLWTGVFNVAPFETAIITAFAVAKFTGLSKALSGAIVASADTGTVIGALVAAFKESATNPAAKSAIAFIFNDFIGKALLGLKVSVPVLVSAGLLEFEWKSGGALEKFKRMVQEQGEEYARASVGTGFYDRQAVYRYDLEQSNKALEQGYLELFDSVGKGYDDWNKKVVHHQQLTTQSNQAISQAYVDMFNNFSTGVKKWFEEDVSPWFTKEKWHALGKNIQAGISMAWGAFYNEWGVKIESWWNGHVTPWFTKEKWSSIANGIKTGIQSKWSEVVNWWSSKTNLSSISVSITDFLQPFKDAWNKVEDWWAGVSLDVLKIDIKVPKFSITYDTKDKNAFAWQSLGLKGTPELGVTWQTFATGGFPEDGWFRASKGEYFGSFDDGTSVIANNNQIISGISNGVKSANAEQNSLLREQNALLRQILAKDTGISTRDIFDAVRSENRDYINRNGESAFAY